MALHFVISRNLLQQHFYALLTYNFAEKKTFPQNNFGHTKQLILFQ